MNTHDRWLGEQLQLAFEEADRGKTRQWNVDEFLAKMHAQTGGRGRLAMPYDETLADRVRPLLSRKRGFAEKKMFGGVGFLLHGNMTVGVWKEFLIVRTGPEAYEDALDTAHVKKFDITGRAMTGWVMVAPGGVETDDDLQAWVEMAVTFVKSLPPK